MSAEKRLKALGLELGKVSAPVANYVNAVRTGNLLFLSGQLGTDASLKLVPGGIKAEQAVITF